MIAIERQTIATWYTPEERMPEEGIFVVVTFSGKYKHTTYDHALGVANWFNDGCGWEVDGLPERAEFTIDAWCDLEPYGGK